MSRRQVMSLTQGAFFAGSSPFWRRGPGLRFGISLLASFVILSGCGSVHRAPIQTVPHVDLQRFMGDWYVIANIPTFVETDAYNAVESYRLDADGTIATTFTFRAGGFDGTPKRYTPRGFVLDTQSNAVWEMQFVWPFKGDYRIVYVNSDYSQTVIGREKRDYVWIMARTPAIPEPDYQSIVAWLATQGYDTTKLQKVPQRWEDRTNPER
jgi:apolipoprotein D and lipocalin family protein